MPHLFSCQIKRSIWMCITLLICIALSTPVHAKDGSGTFEIGAGMGIAEEGDDRIRPAASAHLGFGGDYSTRFHLYGRTSEISSETVTVGSLNRIFNVDRIIPHLRGSLGPAFMLEHTSVEIDDAGNTTEDTQFNIGLNMGIHWRVPINVLMISIGWESHVFLAGEAALLLVTSRKQIVGITFGLGI